MDAQSKETKLTEEEEAKPVVLHGLSRRSQFLIVLVVGGGILAAIALDYSGRLIWHATTEAPVEVETRTDTGFKPTTQQWAVMKIAPISDMVFQPARAAEGKIALDDDLTTQVFSPYSGRVTKLFAQAGDTVKAGDKLMAVEAAEFVQAQNDLISAIATLNTAKAQLKLAQTNEKRQHDLFTANGGSLRDWQQSQVDLATAQGGLQSAEIALGAVRGRLHILGKSDAEIAALEASPDALKFSPEALVLAPIGGTITQRQVGPGQYIVSQANSGSTPAFTIGDLSKVWLVANVREVDAPLIHRGDPVEVTVPAFPGRVFKAKITYVGASIDPNTHRLPVRAEVENEDGALKPEMFAGFRILTGAQRTAPGVPEDAVVYEGDSAHVWLANPKDRTIELRTIKPGLISDGMVEVLDGLKPGDQIVTSGALFIDRAARGD